MSMVDCFQGAMAEVFGYFMGVLECKKLVDLSKVSDLGERIVSCV